MAAHPRHRLAAAQWLTGALFATLVLAAAPPSHAREQQPPTSLGEIARQEAERRKALKAPAKVYTKDDLPRAAQLPVTLPGSAEAGAAQDPAVDPKNPDKAEADKPGAATPGSDKDEAWWRNRITQTREAIRRNEMFVAALQTRINSLAADFASRDDPIQRAQITEERVKAVTELGQVTKEIKELQAEIAQIEEEARQAGVPPAWVR
jgi:hypothetical protein